MATLGTLGTFDPVTAYAAWAAAIAAIVYTGFTIWLAIESWRMRRIQTDPIVVARLEVIPEAGHDLQLVIENVGRGTAFDIQCQILPESAKPAGTFKKIDTLRKRIKALSPGDRRVFTVGNKADMVTAFGQPSVEIVIQFARRAGGQRKLESRCGLDYNSFAGVNLTSQASIDGRAAEYLLMIANRLTAIASSCKQQDPKQD